MIEVIGAIILGIVFLYFVWIFTHEPKKKHN
jgi:hypothetical protein